MDTIDSYRFTAAEELPCCRLTPTLTRALIRIKHLDSTRHLTRTLYHVFEIPFGEQMIVIRAFVIPAKTQWRFRQMSWEKRFSLDGSEKPAKITLYLPYGYECRDRF